MLRASVEESPESEAHRRGRRRAGHVSRAVGPRGPHRRRLAEPRHRAGRSRGHSPRQRARVVSGLFRHPTRRARWPCRSTRGSAKSEAEYVITDSGSKFVCVPDSSAAARASLCRRRSQPDDLSAIFYTSGTTASPKGAMTTHEGFLSNVETCRPRLSLCRSTAACGRSFRCRCFT